MDQKPDNINEFIFAYCLALSSGQEAPTLDPSHVPRAQEALSLEPKPRNRTTSPLMRLRNRPIETLSEMPAQISMSNMSLQSGDNSRET